MGQVVSGYASYSKPDGGNDEDCIAEDVKSELEIDHLTQAMSLLLSEEKGWEVHPFRIGTYNSRVSSHFHLDYADDTLAFIVLNTPKMFEKSLKEWLQEQQGPDESFEDVVEKVAHPIQDFMKDTLNVIPDLLPGCDVDVVHDFDLTPHRRPKVLMCTCGHLAGAAYYYRPEVVFPTEADLDKAFPVRPAKKILGLALHPKYGGHFAYRAVFVLKNVRVPHSFSEKRPKDVFDGDRAAAENCLTLFNSHWRDGRFRDCGDPIERYSDLQMAYFARPPAERWEVIRSWFR